MENALRTLEKIGISADVIDAIRADQTEDAAQTALLLIALYDDRHEYLD